MSDITIAIPIISSAISLYAIVVAFQMTKKRREQLAFINDTQTKLSERSIAECLQDISSQHDEINKKIAASKQPFIMLHNGLADISKITQHIDAGLPPPVFREYDSEQLKQEVIAAREAQYDCIIAGNATRGVSEWTYFGSKSDGAKMVNDYRELLLRAFNAEFETIRKQMRVKTHEAANNKLNRLSDQLEKLGETVGACISLEYFRLKERELECWFDELERIEELKLERARQRAILKEQKASGGDDIDEIEENLAIRETELRRAKKAAEKLIGQDQAKLQVDIDNIEVEIAQLKQKQERATSQAQITRAGFIYVISNHGSFGEGVVKIGMTRRLEPMDRVTELGDASVPFKFDVHTLAFVDDAPRIERALHELFSTKRVNTENHRKEFFYAKPSEVKAEMDKLGIESDWYFDVDAKEYLESQLIRAAMAHQAVDIAASASLPDSI
ncbi:DUF4041 domain-containing protein [Aeromonas media]|uniref:DUF4041 domain-containing protein n=1 Tax=Aeromonas media TaxID=651 RepID=UPI00370A0D42